MSLELVGFTNKGQVFKINVTKLHQIDLEYKSDPIFFNICHQKDQTSNFNNIAYFERLKPFYNQTFPFPMSLKKNHFLKEKKNPHTSSPNKHSSQPLEKILNTPPPKIIIIE